MRLSATGVREQFFPHNHVARPGDRVVDLYSHRLFFDLSAPKRASKFFDGWVRDFKAKIEDFKNDGRTLIFSDGAYWTKSSRAAYAFTAYHDTKWHDMAWWCPASSSYDAEITALEEAIQWAILKRVQHPVFFVDNKAVITSFLDLDTHSSQLSSIHINILLHDYLLTTDNNISFAFCPSHVGIEGNERADRLTKEGAALGPTKPFWILRSNFLGQFKRDMTVHWRTLATSQTYKGRSWMPTKRKRRVFKPDVTNRACRRFFMTLSGNDITTISRMARTLTNHAPTGKYRRRFYPDKLTFCKFCGPATEHTRNHALFTCPQYEPLAASFTDWKRDRNNHKSWMKYFQANPSAMTFGDLLDDVH
ncbi:hypothetical protein AX14_007068 [Amanita brunnescens Koide BX004]|nr:hypothetical protein AX14_007068 [Amanita brunnescens Koide BX004]